MEPLEINLILKEIDSNFKQPTYIGTPLSTLSSMRVDTLRVKFQQPNTLAKVVCKNKFKFFYST